MALTNLSQITTSGIATGTDLNIHNITGAAATFTGNVTVGGTLTYEDVTNIDSVGLITARSGISVTGGDVNLTSGNLALASATPMVVASNGSGHLRLGAGGSEKVRIKSDGKVGIGTTNPTAKLTINPLTTLSTSGDIGGVSIANTENKTYPTTSSFNATLGLNQNIEVGGTQVINPSTPGGYSYISGIKNYLKKDNGNTQDIERSYYYGLDQRFSWNDLNTCKQYVSIFDSFVYGGIDTNGRTSSFFGADTVILLPPEGGQQTVASVDSKSFRIRGNAATGISTVAVTNVTGYSPYLIFQNFNTGTHNNSITNYSAFKTSQYWGTQGSTGTLNATITNYYGLHLNAPNNSTGLTITNNYGVYSGWSDSINYFAGNVGIGTDNPEEELSIQLDSSSDGPTLRLRNPDGGDGTYTGRILTGDAAGTFFAGINFLKHDTNDGEIRLRTKVAGSNTDVVTIVDGESKFTVGTNKFVKFYAPTHNDEADLGAGIAFSRPSDGADMLSGMFAHSNTGLGIAARDHITLLTGGTSTVSDTEERVRITSDGKVGINTTNPQAKLELDGRFRILDNSDGTPSSGKGLEISYYTGDDLADILSYDRGSSAYKKLQLRGSSIELKKNNSVLCNIGTGGNGVSVGFSTTSNLVTNGERIAVRGYSSFKSTNPSYAAIYVGSEGDTADTPNQLLMFNNDGANRGGFGYVPNTGELRLNNQHFMTFCTGAGVLGGDERLRITSGGLVGIGTTNPGTKLHVHGNGNESITLRLKQGTTPGNYSSLQVGRTDGAGNPHITDAVTGGIPIAGIPGILLGSSNTGVPAVSIQSANSANGHIVFSPKGTEKVRIASNGAVGIGTNSPDDKLHVLGGNIQIGKTEESGYETIINNNSFSFNRSAASYINQRGTGDIRFRYGTNNLTWMHMEGSSGHIGIGTDAPDHRLEVFGSPGPGDLSIKSAASAAGGTEHSKLRFRVRNPSNQESTLASIHVKSDSNWGGSLIFGTKTASGGLSESTVERLRIKHDGKVGIGTQAYGDIDPLAPLHVSSYAPTTAITDHQHLRNAAQILCQTSNNVNNSRSGIMFSGALHSTDGCSAGIIANHENVAENSETTSLSFYTSYQEVIGERFRIFADGQFDMNGVRNIFETFRLQNNIAYEFDYTVPNEGGYGNSFRIEAGYNHYYAATYGAHRTAWVSTRGTNLAVMVDQNQNTSQAGGWSFSKPNSTTLRVTKSAGSYGGQGYGFLHIRYNHF